MTEADPRTSIPCAERAETKIELTAKAVEIAKRRFLVAKVHRRLRSACRWWARALPRLEFAEDSRSRKV